MRLVPNDHVRKLRAGPIPLQLTEGLCRLKTDEFDDRTRELDEAERQPRVRWSHESIERHMYYKVSQKKQPTTASVRWNPARKCPFRLFHPHEVCPEGDPDWTIPGSHEEMKLRDMRNFMLKESLTHGVGCQYRAMGRSLYPTVKPGDCCFIEPVVNPDSLQPGNIVFCQVQPGNRFVVDTIMRMDDDGAAVPAQERRRWMVKNGWCYDRHIYGRLVECLKTTVSIE